MKKAEGAYVEVRAITREEAIKMAPEMFEIGDELENIQAEAYRLEVEGDRLWDEGNRLWDEWDSGKGLRAESKKLSAEADRLKAEAGRLLAEGRILLANIAIERRGHVLDWQAINLIAADRDDDVYSFVWPDQEIWVYDGDERPPDPDKVEKVKWWKADEKS